MRQTITILVFSMIMTIGFAQTGNEELPVKISHAEPLYFDLIRDLGARRGEKEWNMGMMMSSAGAYRENTWFIEYEFAPVNRLGMEIEIPFSFYTSQSNSDDVPRNGLDGVKTAVQYSFFVSSSLRTTMAAGYIFESLSAGSRFLKFQGSSHNPFLVVAKRWGNQFHTMLYAGPVFEYVGGKRGANGTMINTSIHYILPGTKNFIGIETNEEIGEKSFTMMVHPQLKVKLASGSALGMAVGIPVTGHEALDFMIRYIYEPSKK